MKKMQKTLAGVVVLTGVLASVNFASAMTMDGSSMFNGDSSMSNGSDSSMSNGGSSMSNGTSSSTTSGKAKSTSSSSSWQDLVKGYQFNDTDSGMVGGNLTSDENEVNNEDEYIVDQPTVHEGNLVLNNVDSIDISDTLIVRGDMIVSNADTFIVTGKLRVTGKLQVNNVDINNKGGRIYFGKKQFSNGVIKGKAMKVMPELAKIDPLLKADLTDAEWKDLNTTAQESKTELAQLKKDLAAAKKQKTDTASILQKVLDNREAFFTEVAGLVSEDDQTELAKLQAADLKTVKRTFGIK